MTNLNELTIQQASEGLRKKQFSAVELNKACLEETQKQNDELNAYLEVFDDALKEAERADEEISKYQNSEMSRLPPLLGIPLAIKDNILIEGRRATAGSKILQNYTASYDATVITKLKKQGAIFLGKTNLDEFAMGSSTENSGFGPTKNPHDLTRVPGGSSGGSAAAVTSGMCIAALGSDTGGSIRQPASFCGIVGLKPTYGSVSRHGLIAMASSLDQIGPMTKTVEDAKIVFEAIAGKDNFDSTTIGSVDELRTTSYELKNIKIGTPKEYFGPGLKPEVKKTIDSALKKIQAAGAEIKEISLPHSKYALPVYYIIVPSEVSANLARFDGIRYGRQTNSAHTLLETYTKTRATGLGAEVKRRIMLGTYTLSAGYYDAYYLKAQKVRRLIHNDFENAFKEVDFIIGPTTPTAAFKLGERSNDPLQMYLADIYTVAVNLAGLPALSMPAGFIEEGGQKLPVGLQLIGPWHGENKLLDIAMVIEKILNVPRGYHKFLPN